MLDPVVEANREMLHARSQLGIRKYGGTLDEKRYPRRQILQHALEEALDLANYLQADIQSIDRGASVTGESLAGLKRYKQTWDSTSQLMERPDGDYYKVSDVEALFTPAPVPAACQHDNRTAHWDWLTCDDCGGFHACGKDVWGVAARMWFKNEAEARFYKEHGRYPDLPRIDGCHQ